MLSSQRAFVVPSAPLKLCFIVLVRQVWSEPVRLLSPSMGEMVGLKNGFELDPGEGILR